jgi:hypothetical protein
VDGKFFLVADRAQIVLLATDGTGQPFLRRAAALAWPRKAHAEVRLQATSGRLGQRAGQAREVFESEIRDMRDVDGPERLKALERAQAIGRGPAPRKVRDSSLVSSPSGASVATSMQRRDASQLAGVEMLR